MNENEIFEAAANGQAKKVEEMLDAGVDVDLRDFDRKDTPLHFACSKGQQGVIELLVDRGADVNVQNNRGQVPLHALVKKRFDLLALWLIRHGADHNIEDEKNCTPRDFALDWFQKDMDEAAEGILPEGAAEAKAALEAAQNAGNDGKKGPNDAIVKVYTRSGLYKTVFVSPEDSARELSEKVAKKMGKEELGSHLDIISAKNADSERRLTPAENIHDVMSKWEGEAGAKFLVVVKKGTPATYVSMFRAAMK